MNYNIFHVCVCVYMHVYIWLIYILYTYISNNLELCWKQMIQKNNKLGMNCASSPSSYL